MPDGVNLGIGIMEKPLPPHWILRGGIKRCSECGYFFPSDTISIDKAFKEHMAKAHKPGQTREDMSQAVAHIVWEATDK